MNGCTNRQFTGFFFALVLASASAVNAQTHPPLVSAPTAAPALPAAALPPPVPDAALLERGQQRLAGGDLEGAVKAFSDAAAEVPQSPAAYHLLAIADLHAGRYEQAAQAAQHALDDCPGQQPGHSANAVLLGRALYGEYREKLAAWNDRYAALPGAAQLLRQMSQHQWEEPNGVVITEQTDVDAAPIFDGMRDSVVTEIYAMRHLLNHSETAYQDAIAVNAGERGAHDGLGLVLAAADESTQARREINRELEIQGPSALVYQHLGELDMEDADNASAVENLRHSLAISPQTILVYDDLAKVYGRQHDESGAAWAGGMSLLLRGRSEDARQTFAKAPPSCDIRRAQAMLCLAQRQADQARSYLVDALKTAPQDAKTLTMLADVETGQSHWDMAMTSYQHALAADPGNDAAWYGVGLVSDKLNKPAEAIAAYAKALTINPDNVLARLNIAADEVDAGQKQAAISDMREYLTRFPMARDSSDVKAMLAQTEGSL